MTVTGSDVEPVSVIRRLNSSVKVWVAVKTMLYVEEDPEVGAPKSTGTLQDPLDAVGETPPLLVLAGSKLQLKELQEMLALVLVACPDTVTGIRAGTVAFAAG